MLVLNERADAPYSEKVVAGWLRSCHVPGVAIAGGYVPGRGHRARGQEADFIVFTEFVRMYRGQRHTQPHRWGVVVPCERPLVDARVPG